MEKGEKLDKYYKSRVHASSIIVVRPFTEEERGSGPVKQDFKILTMKRNPRIIFGGYFAFSGGKVENQDLFENWVENYPEMFGVNGVNRKYFDFNARICGIRETFEEINILIVKPLKRDAPRSLIPCSKTLRELYTTVYKSNFLEMCKDFKVIPDFEQVYGYRRVSTGNLIIPGIDN